MRSVVEPTGDVPLILIRSQGYETSSESYIINILTIRHRKDWVCRIDLRRTFGINPRAVSISALASAINQASHYMSLHPLEQVEVYFRAGTYHPPAAPYG